MNNNRNAVIYIRANAPEIITPDGAIVFQEERCRDYASKRGYSVLKAFWDVGVPATMEERPQFAEMLDFLAVRRADAPIVIVDRPSVIGRDAATYTKLRDAIRQTGATLESPVFGYEPETVKDAFAETLYAEMARHEARLQESAERETGLLRRLIGTLRPRSR